MSAREGFVFDGLDLNDGVLYTIEALDIPTPAKRMEWIQGADADGSLLGRDPLVENREITARIRVKAQSTMDSALAKIGSIVDKIEKAELTDGGLGLVWAPATSTNSFTFYVLTGEITGIPLEVSGTDTGWFVRSPVVTVKLTCKPYGYEVEQASFATTTSSSPLITLELTSVPGDVPAEGRLIVTDAASKDRRHLEWGIESRYYPTSSPPSLIVDSDSLVTSGFAGTGTTRAGAYDPNASGNSVVRATVYSLPTAVCGTGNLSHVGSFRVKARVWVSSGSVRARLSWAEGYGPLRSNPWADPPTPAAWTEIDLGIITIPPKVLGTQRWSGQIDAYGVAGDTIDVDFLMLFPADEGYGTARADAPSTSGSVTGFDSFDGLSAGTALNGRTASAGGTWATSGSSTDFAVDAAALNLMSRSTTSDGTPRFAILGSATPTDTEVQVQVRFSSLSVYLVGAIARWVSSSNYFRAWIDGTGNFTAEKVISGTPTVLDTTTFSPAVDTFYRIHIKITAGGVGTVYLLTGAGAQIARLGFSDTALATGGTLDDGKPGFIDFNNTAASLRRDFDEFYVATPAAEPIVIYSGQSAEVRSDSAIHEDSSGTYWGPVPAYRGSRLFIPIAGDAGRKARIAVKARRNDIEIAADDQIADSTTVTVALTPRWLAIPR